MMKQCCQGTSADRHGTERSCLAFRVIPSVEHLAHLGETSNRRLVSRFGSVVMKMIASPFKTLRGINLSDSERHTRPRIRGGSAVMDRFEDSEGRVSRIRRDGFQRYKGTGFKDSKGRC